MMTELKTTQRDAGWFFCIQYKLRTTLEKRLLFFVIC